MDDTSEAVGFELGEAQAAHIGRVLAAIKVQFPDGWVALKGLFVDKANDIAKRGIRDKRRTPDYWHGALDTVEAIPEQLESLIVDAMVIVERTQEQADDLRASVAGVGVGSLADE